MATTDWLQFAALVFGIKAKPENPTAQTFPEFAALVFGIKAKPEFQPVTPKR